MLFCKPEDDAADFARIRAKLEYWPAHWRVGDEKVRAQYKAWEDREPEKKSASPSLSVKTLHRAVTAFEATTGVGVDGSHPRVPPEFSDWCCRREFSRFWVTLTRLKFGQRMPALLSSFSSRTTASARLRCFLR